MANLKLQHAFSIVRDKVIKDLENLDLEDEDLLKLSPRNIVEYDRIFCINA
jgi:hypothetical protein